jgi:predicted Zn-dependent protease
MRFAKRDDELAFILSHETAHNIMHHIDAERRNALIGAVIGALADGIAAYNRVNTHGDMTQAGFGTAQLSWSPAFEAEADYVGLYILARSGYDYHFVPEFWRRLAAREPGSIYAGGDHPSDPERYVAMEKTIREIDAKRAKHLPLLPNLREDADSAGQLTPETDKNGNLKNVYRGRRY